MAAPAHIQSKSATSGATTVSSQSTGNFASAVTSGSSIVVFVAWNNVNSVITVTDNQSNSYSAVAARQNFSTATSRCFLATNVTGGTLEVTANAGTEDTNQLIVAAHEVGASVLDDAASAAGSSISPNSGALTPSEADVYLFGAGVVSSNRTWTQGDGYTLAEGGTARYATQYKTLGSPVSSVSDFSLSDSIAWGCWLVVLRNAAGLVPHATTAYYRRLMME
jgi:hypothetical protein